MTGKAGSGRVPHVRALLVHWVARACEGASLPARQPLILDSSAKCLCSGSDSRFCCTAFAALAVLPAALYDRPRLAACGYPDHDRGGTVSLRVSGRNAECRAPRAAGRYARDAVLSGAAAGACLPGHLRDLSHHRAWEHSCCRFVFCWACCLRSGPGSKRQPCRDCTRAGCFCTSRCCWRAYAALFVSLVTSTLYLVQERRLKNKSVRMARVKLPPLDTLDRIALRALAAGPAVHDGGVVDWLAAGAGDLRCNLLPRPQNPARVRDCGWPTWA